MASIITTSATIYEGTLFIDNLKSFMNEKKTVVAVADPPVKVRHGEPHTIEFRSVSFKYPQTEKYVLKDVSFTFSGE